MTLDECWFGPELRPVAEAMGLGELNGVTGHYRDDGEVEWIRFGFNRGSISVFVGTFIATLAYNRRHGEPGVELWGSYDEVLRTAQHLGVHHLANGEME